VQKQQNGREGARGSLGNCVSSRSEGEFGMAGRMVWGRKESKTSDAGKNRRDEEVRGGTLSTKLRGALSGGGRRENLR